MSNIVTASLTYFPSKEVGRPLFNGYIYVGEPDTDPLIPANQKTVTLKLENGSTVVASQPLRTNAGGVVTYNGDYAVMTTDGDFSLLAQNRNQAQEYYIPNNTGLFPIDQADITGMVSKTVADMTDASGVILTSGDTIDAARMAVIANTGALLETSEYYSGTGVGGAEYEIKTRAQHRTDIGDAGWVADGYVDHYLLGGTTYVAIADRSDGLFVTQCGAFCTADGTAGVGADDTAALQACADVLGYIRLPVDRAPRITAPLDFRSGKYFSEYTDLRGVVGIGGCIVLDDASATAYDKFITEPRSISNVAFIGTSKVCTGLSIERADSTTNFLGWARYDNVHVSGCKRGVLVGNCFNIEIGMMVVEENEYGLEINPVNTAGDDGYVTTLTFEKLICRQNDQWGLECVPALKSPNVAFNHLNIETNNQVGGTYQARIKNLDPFSGTEWYLEGSNTVYCLDNNGGNRGRIDGIYQNACGDMNLSTVSCDLDIQGHKITATGGTVIASGGVNQAVKWANSTLLFNGGSLPSIKSLELENVTADGIYYNTYKKGSSVDFNHNAIGVYTNGHKSITAFSESFAGKTIVAGTNNTVISDTFVGGGITENTVGIARIRDAYIPGLILQVHPRGSDANTDYYRVMAYNFTGSDIILSAGTMDLVFIKTE